jgi:hypothetical protein
MIKIKCKIRFNFATYFVQYLHFCLSSNKLSISVLNYRFCIRISSSICNLNVDKEILQQIKVYDKVYLYNITFTHQINTDKYYYGFCRYYNTYTIFSIDVKCVKIIKLSYLILQVCYN